jgi:hypothetical protein
MGERDSPTADGPEYGETWVYEGIIGAIPGLSLAPRMALVLQFLAFECAVLLLGWVYDLPGPAFAGTVAVLVATIGSAALLRIAGQVRREPVPEAYRRLLFGSNIEVVLAVFAFCALITHLFVLDVQVAETTLIESLFGETPPAPAIFLTLLILWDVCYRIGAGWWASVAALYRSVTFRFDARLNHKLRRIDVETAGFGVLQLVFVPFLFDQPVLFAAVVGHVLAVLLVTTLSVALLTLRENETTATYSDS